MFLTCSMTMKFVVTGTPGESSCSRSRSATKWASSSSELNRRKSSCWVGLGKVGRGPRREDLVERAVVLGPEGGAPGVVERVDVVRIAAASQARKACGADVAVAQRVVAAELVADVPQGERRMVARTARPSAGTAPGRARGRPASSGRRPAARPVAEPGPVRGHREHLRVPLGQPRRRRRRRGREVDRDPAGVEAVRARRRASRSRSCPSARLQQGPGEHADRHQVDPGLAASGATSSCWTSTGHCSGL